MESCKKSIAFLVTLCLFGAVIQVIAQDRCQACMANSAYCVNETSYYICYDGINPSKDALLSCAPGQHCTSSSSICQTANIPPLAACNAASDTCSKCVTDQKFTCVSKTRYALCVSGKPAASSASCGTDEICSMDSIDAQGHICLPQCAADYLKFEPTCSNDITTTAAPVTTPKPDAGILRGHCAAECLAGADFCYTTNPTDTATCKSYLYCEKGGTAATPAWEYVVLNCKTGIWNDDTKKCDVNATCEDDTGSGGGDLISLYQLISYSSSRF